MRVVLAFVALTALVVLLLRRAEPRGLVERQSAEVQGPTLGDEVSDHVLDLAGPTLEASDLQGESANAARRLRTRVDASVSGRVGSSESDAGSFNVAVVTAEGAPARGVALSFELEEAVRGGTSIFAERRTGEDGRAEFELRDCAELYTTGADTLRGTLRIIADVLHAHTVALLLPEVPRDGDELRLELPPGGTVVARVKGPDGGVLTVPNAVICRLMPWDLDEPRGRSYHPKLAHRVESVAGIARFEHVALELDVSLSAHADGYESGARRTIAGPSCSGDVVDVVLPLGVRTAIVRARILTATDAPLRSARVRVSLGLDPLRARRAGERPQPEWMSDVTTDEAGGVELDVSADLDPWARDLWVVWADPAWTGQGPRDRCGHVWLPAGVSRGATIDAGEIVLAPASLLAAGSVVGVNGMALEHATLEFSERFAQESDSTWFPMEGSQVQTDAAGRFALYGTSRPTALKARVEAAEHASCEFPDLVPGETRSRFVLERPAPGRPRSSLAFELVGDDVLRGVALTVSLQRDGDDRPAVLVEAPTWPTQFGRLEPGTYTFEVLLRETSISFARVTDIEVREGELTSDPRLMPLDLSGLARRVDLVVLQPDDAPRGHALVELTPEGQSAWTTRETDWSGAVAFHVPRACDAVSARLAGSEDVVRVPLATGDGPLRVVLRSR